MSGYTKVNLKADVENMAPKYGMAPDLESHFGREPLGLENSGVSLFKLAPKYRMPFGHSHGEQEEVYVLVDGSARLKLDDEVLELDRWDAVRIPPGTMRAIEGGPGGCELLAFGAPNTQNADAEMIQGWWSD